MAENTNEKRQQAGQQNLDRDKLGEQQGSKQPAEQDRMKQGAGEDLDSDLDDIEDEDEDEDKITQRNPSQGRPEPT